MNQKKKWYTSGWSKLLSALGLTAPLLGLSLGESAPSFSARNQDGKRISLSDPAFKGKNVVLFFYPKDGTPGCTQEVCVLRDHFKSFENQNTVLLGVSGQGMKSHKRFKAQHQLPFDLLADEQGTLRKKFGVGVMLPVIGKFLKLSKRQTVVLTPISSAESSTFPAGATHRVFKVYKNVTPSLHAQEILEDLKDGVKESRATQSPKAEELKPSGKQK